MTPLPPTRRGACPSLSTPMQTGDGLITRLSPLNGALSADQLQQIANLSATHGNGLLEITNRGNLQFRGLTAHSAPLLAKDIERAGITARSGIAIDINPLSGLDDTGTRDARPLAAAIRAGLEQASWHTRLAPKMSVVIDGGGAVSLSNLIADLRLVAHDGTTKRDCGWLLYIGGTQSGSRNLGLLCDDAKAVVAVLALLQCLADKGNAARGRDLTDRDLSCLERTALQPAPDPVRQTLAQLPVSLIGTIGLRDDTVAVGFGLEFGTITAPVLADFAMMAARAAGARQQGDQIRLAIGKVLFVLVRDRASGEALQKSAAQLGLICKPNDPRLRFVTCAGAPACASAHLNTHRLALDILAHCADQLAPTSTASPPASKIHISGCEKCCARPGNAMIDIIASPQGAQITCGGALQADKVPISDIPDVVVNAISTSPEITRP